MQFQISCTLSYNLLTFIKKIFFPYYDDALQGYGCFNGFIVSMLIVYLLYNRKIHKLMTSYQILRITLEHLGR